MPYLTSKPAALAPGEVVTVQNSDVLGEQYIGDTTNQVVPACGYTQFQGILINSSEENGGVLMFSLKTTLNSPWSWTKTSDGIYMLTADDCFTENKTFFPKHASTVFDDDGNRTTVTMTRVDSSTVQVIITYNDGEAYDSAPLMPNVEIMILP